MMTAFQNLLPPNPFASNAATALGLPMHSARPGWSFELISVPGERVASSCSSDSPRAAFMATSRVRLPEATLYVSNPKFQSLMFSKLIGII